MKPGESKAVVNVPKPNPRCWDARAAVVESFVVDPPVDPTQAFSVGYHSFTYTLKLKGRNMDVVCPVAFSVYGEYNYLIYIVKSINNLNCINVYSESYPNFSSSRS